MYLFMELAALIGSLWAMMSGKFPWRMVFNVVVGWIALIWLAVAMFIHLCYVINHQSALPQYSQTQ